jgi:hypothetical protein
VLHGEFCFHTPEIDALDVKAGCAAGLTREPRRFPVKSKPCFKSILSNTLLFIIVASE